MAALKILLVLAYWLALLSYTYRVGGLNLGLCACACVRACVSVCVCVHAVLVLGGLALAILNGISKLCILYECMYGCALVSCDELPPLSLCSFTMFPGIVSRPHMILHQINGIDNKWMDMICTISLFQVTQNSTMLKAL